MEIKIDRQKSQSLYQQIAEQIKTQISTGRLPAGARLPTVRQLARQLTVSRLTIQDAYGELKGQGWIEATVGRGTFVSSHSVPTMLAPSIGQTLSPVALMHDIMFIKHATGLRSLAVADPDSAFFPLDEFNSAVSQALSVGATLFHYGSTLGDSHLRVALSDWLLTQKIVAMPDTIMITNGAMHAFSLAVRTLAHAGDKVLIERPSFIGFLNVLRAHGIQPISVPLDEHGLSMSELERQIQEHRPRFICTIPNFHNPTGICMAMERRQQLLDLAQRYNTIIIEDDCYTSLAYDHPAPPHLKSLDVDGRVIHVGGFAKNLMPGLRLGYLVAPHDLLPAFMTIRHASDVCGAPLLQRAMAYFLEDGGLTRHLERTLPIYRRRRDATARALAKYIPDAKWTLPHGGFSFWLLLPQQNDPGQVYRQALQQRLAILPGAAFFDDPQPQQTYFRLCFGNQSEAALEACIAQLGKLIV